MRVGSAQMHGRDGDSSRRQGRLFGQWRRSRFLYALVAIALIPVFPGSALVWAPITIDGSYTDWSPVFDDAGNCQYDTTGDAGNTNADVTLAAVTGDSTYLYHYFRRAAASGGAAPTFFVFLDLGGDQRMGAGDRVMQYRLTGGNNFSSASLYQYQPADPVNGDPMGGAIAGTWPNEINFATAPYLGFGEVGGAQFEGRITWAALGVPAKSPICVQFAAQQGSTVDYTGMATTRTYAVTVDPDLTAGKAQGETAVYRHTVKNTGNSPARFYLTASPSHPAWTTTIRRADNQQAVGFFDLLPDQQVDIEVLLAIPLTAPSGTRDTMVVTAREESGRASESATDITNVGSLLVIPDGRGSICPGGTIVFENSVINNTNGTLSAALTASSAHGWLTRIYDTTGTEVSQVDVPANSSVVVRVHVIVPADADLGTVDVTALEARVSPSVRAKGYDTTTVRRELDVSPDNALPAGPGTSVLYRHTVTNSSAESRTFALNAISSKGWSATVFAADGSTPLPSVALSAYGGSAEVIVRVTVPAGTPLLVNGQPNLDTTTLTATFGAGLAETATDVTTVTSLATFGISGFGTPLNTFDLGDRVYARGMGLNPGSTMTFVWTDPNNVDVTTTTARVDATGIAQSSHTVGAAQSNVGTWTVRLYNGTTLVDTKQFYVGYRASVSALAATGGDLVETPVSVSASVTNSGAEALPDTILSYRIWWDADGDGIAGPNDSYIEQGGAWTSIGTGTGYTWITGGVSVAQGATVSDGWSVSNLDFRESGTYQLTAVWTRAGVLVDERTTTFFAVPGRPALSVSVSAPAIDFGTVTPGISYSQPLTLGVTALVDYTLSAGAPSGHADMLGLSHTFSSSDGGPTVSTNYGDIISILVPWSTDPGAYSASITYTIVAR